MRKQLGHLALLSCTVLALSLLPSSAHAKCCKMPERGPAGAAGPAGPPGPTGPAGPPGTPSSFASVSLLTTPAIINPGDPVPFDTENIPPQGNITYNPLTFEFTLINPGFYSVSCAVTTPFASRVQFCCTLNGVPLTGGCMENGDGGEPTINGLIFQTTLPNSTLSLVAPNGATVEGVANPGSVGAYLSIQQLQ